MFKQRLRWSFESNFSKLSNIQIHLHVIFPDLCETPLEPPNFKSKCLGIENRTEIDFTMISKNVNINGVIFTFDTNAEDPQMLNGEPIFVNAEKSYCAWFSAQKQAWIITHCQWTGCEDTEIFDETSSYSHCPYIPNCTKDYLRWSRGSESSE